MKLYVLQIRDSEDGDLCPPEVYADQAEAERRYKSIKDDVGITVGHWGAQLDIAAHDAEVRRRAVAEALAEVESQLQDRLFEVEADDGSAAEVISEDELQRVLLEVAALLSSAPKDPDCASFLGQAGPCPYPADHVVHQPGTRGGHPFLASAPPSTPSEPSEVTR